MRHTSLLSVVGSPPRWLTRSKSVTEINRSTVPRIIGFDTFGPIVKDQLRVIVKSTQRPLHGRDVILIIETTGLCMNHETIPSGLRRSSRVPAAIPIFVTSLNGTSFSEMCETLVVSAHGCAIRSSVKLDTGVPLHFHNNVGRETTAQVVSCYPIGPDNQGWLLGAKLDRPENFWGLPNYAKDWALTLTSTSPRIPSPPIQGSHDLPSHALELPGGRAAPQLSEKDVRRLI